MKETLLEILARLECDIKELQSKPTIKQIDFSKDIDLIKKELLDIKNTILNKEKIDIKDKIKEIVTQNFITNLYRNQNG